MEQAGKTGTGSTKASGFSWRMFAEDFWFRNMRVIVTAAVLVVAAAVAWFVWSAIRESRAAEDNKKLGVAYVLLRGDDPAAAEQALRTFLAGNPTGLARDKANLFLGKLLYRQERYDEALAAYEQVRSGGKKLALLRAGALHGRAAIHMQQADYASAAKLLEELVGSYGVRTGDPREDVVGSEVMDFSPNVPNALWKLALCRRELGEADKARAAAERIVRAYPGSREAQDAARLLVTL